MTTFEQLTLEKILKTLEQMSARLDDIAARLPMPAYSVVIPPNPKDMLVGGTGDK